MTKMMRPHEFDDFAYLLAWRNGRPPNTPSQNRSSETATWPLTESQRTPSSYSWGLSNMALLRKALESDANTWAKAPAFRLSACLRWYP